MFGKRTAVLLFLLLTLTSLYAAVRWRQAAQNTAAKAAAATALADAIDELEKLVTWEQIDNGTLLVAPLLSVERSRALILVAQPGHRSEQGGRTASVAGAFEARTEQDHASALRGWRHRKGR